MAIGDTFRVEAETFALITGFFVQSNSQGSAGAFLQAGSSAEQRASYTFNGTAGTYSLTVGYFDESDGASELSVLVNGVLVDSWVWDANPGGAFADQSSKTTYTISGIALEPGDVIELVGFSDGGEPLRVDYVDFTETGSTGADVTGPVVQSAAAPDVGIAGGATTTVTVTYADFTAVDVSTLDAGDITVTGPTGALTITGVTVNTATDGSPRTVTYTVAAPGGSWDVADNGTYTVALKGTEVFDTLGNASTASASIAGFSVDISDGTPPDPFRVEAETFTIVSGFIVQSNSQGSGGAFLQAGSSSEQRASYVFNETAGTYSLTIGYFDESDGSSQLSVLVDGTVIDSWVWDADPGGASANNTSRTTRTIEGVALAPGDVIQLVGFGNGGEPLRVDFVDFAYTGSSGSDVTGPVVQSAAAQSVTSAGGATTTVTVTYADFTAVDVSTLDAGDITVTGPTGALTITGVTVNTATDGSPRTVTYTVAAPGGSWDAADNGAYTVALKGTEVFDTLGNASSASASIAGFSVSISDGTPPDPFRVEAETFTIVSGFIVQSNSQGSGGAFLQAGSSAEQRASYSFNEAGGTYSLTIGYFDESDGASQLSVLVNGAVIDSWVWDANPGGAFADSTSKASRTISGVALATGDTIQLVGFSDGGEPLRVDYIDFTFTGTSGPDLAGPTVQSVAAPNLTAFNEGAATTTVTVTYADSTAVDVSTLDAGDITVTGPTGALSVTGFSVNTATDGSPRTVTYTIAAPGGSWDTADNGTYTVALKGTEVFDTLGNASTASASIGSFSVNISEEPEPVSFATAGLQGELSNNPTAIDVSKTGNPVIFVAQQDGTIYRYEIARQPDGSDADSVDDFVATSALAITAIKTQTQNYDDNGAENTKQQRQVTGLVTTKDADGNDVLYVSSSDWRIAVGNDSGLDTNSGQIHRLVLDPDTGAVLSNVAILRGLPRSEENHSTNGLDISIDPATGDTILWIASGGFTNKGAPGNNFAGTIEYALAGAVLKVNLTQLEAYDVRTDANGDQYILDLPTLDDPTRANVDLASLNIQNLAAAPNFTLDANGGNPDWAGGNNGLNMAKITDYVLVSEGGQLKLVENPLAVHAPGFRNIYDVLVLSNGEVVTWDNGPNGGWGGQPLSWSDGQIVNDWTSEFATNQFSESGSTGFGDQLHYLGKVTDPYGPYGGHAHPIRAAAEALAAAFNPDGTYKGTTASDPIVVNSVTLFDNEADARAFLAALMIIYVEQGDGNWVDDTASTGLPADFFDVVSGYDWSHPGSSISNPLSFFDGSSVMDGTAFSPESQLLDPSKDGSIFLTPESTNGLAEYTATFFGGQLEGAIVAASFDGNLYLVKPLDTDGDGRMDDAVLLATIGNFGSSPLAVAALGDDGFSSGVLIDNNGDGIDDFAGLIIGGTYGSDDITFFIPGGAPTPPGDDLDGDGIDNIDDTHVGDPLDGKGVIVGAGQTAKWDFELNNPASTPPGAVAPGDSIAGDIGINAVWRNGILPAVDNGGDRTAGLYNGGVFNLGGASTFVSLDIAHDGAAEGTANSQQDVLGIGFAAGQNVGALTISANMVNIFTYSLNNDAPESSWDGGEKVGLFVGPGDQSNFAEATIAVIDDNGTIRYGVQLLVEENDSFVTAFVEIPGIEAPIIQGLGDPNFEIAIDLDLTFGAETAIARARYVDDGVFTDWVSTAALTLPDDVVAAVKGQYDNLGKLTGAVVGLVASAETGDDSFAASWDWIEVQGLEGSADPGTGEATFAVKETSNAVGTSSYDTGSFVIANVGDKKIAQVQIDITNALYPDTVFDPFGLAGDTVFKGLTIDTAGGTGVVAPTSASYVGLGGTAGYEGIVLTFDALADGGFEPGEQLAFSIDADPNSVAGAGKDTLAAGSEPTWDVGGVSGAELIGASFTVTFTDGTTATGQLHGSGTQGGSKGLASQDSPDAQVTLTVEGLAPGGIGTYPPGGPTVVVNGPAGETVRVVLTKGFIQPVSNEFYNGDSEDQAYAPQLDAQLAELAASDFPANNAVEFQTVDVLLTGGNQDISHLFNFNQVAGYDFDGEDQVPLGFVAAVIDPDNGNLPIGPVTAPIYLTSENSSPPPPPPADPFRVEAESLTLDSGFVVKSNPHPSGGFFIQAGGSGEQRASLDFAQGSGTYDITLGYFDENDGASQLSVLLNGQVIDSFLFDLDAGGAFADSSSFATRTISDVAIETGDVIELVGFQDAAEPLRIDYLDFAPSDDLLV